jgi:hypothetical protein
MRCKVSSKTEVAQTYSFASRFNGYRVAELAQADQQIVDLGSGLGR